MGNGSIQRVYTAETKASSPDLRVYGAFTKIGRPVLIVYNVYFVTIDMSYKAFLVNMPDLLVYKLPL